jgi:hypothetical protein
MSDAADMPSFLTSAQKVDFAQNGLIVVDNFLSQDEVTDLRSEIMKLVHEMDPKKHRGVFSTVSPVQVYYQYILIQAFRVDFRGGQGVSPFFLGGGGGGRGKKRGMGRGRQDLFIFDLKSNQSLDLFYLILDLRSIFKKIKIDFNF